eukprot:TRINITY_DN38653_c0_g1_i1.p1 TRINITY_DN38653_c0_g1~~TRINITY_DN38653_c0_g1_i1.p1  ORF type:complete len:103 (+),score=17.55 TRINITY_DN38653_c0_g1_i1:48-311(+)
MCIRDSNNPFSTSTANSSGAGGGGGGGSPHHLAVRVVATNAHLNTGIGLKSRKVSVLMINMCDYHQQLQQHTPVSYTHLTLPTKRIV